MKKWLLRIVAVIVGLLVAAFGVLSALPVPVDAAVPPSEAGAGASSVEPSTSGLQRAFPDSNEPADNPTTPARVELGRQLFFDPILSAGDDVSCASCHHPDFGFADGLALAQGAGATGAGPQRAGGVTLTRNTPALWNVAYATSLFWDGRAASLEDQSLVPLTHADEMGADAAGVVAEVGAIDAYAPLFAAAFGDADVSQARIQMALAAFQRSLISENSPFDRYAAGNFEALTPSQRRGLALFRSGATRCFECHTAPTFASNNFRVVGVPDDDPGRAGVADDAPAGAFRVPTLRNIALTAPYMHDGSLATLEDVVDFYAAGGGRAFDRPDVDTFVRGFDLTGQERADLVAFLHALTDEAALPTVPASALSGLPVVPRLVNGARHDVSAVNASPGAGTIAAAPAREPRTITVRAGETIQTAVDRARPGDTVEVPYGVYHERVVVDMSDITLVGVPNEAGERPILDGQGRLADGVIASGNNFTVGHFSVRNYTDNGILVEGVTGVHFHDILAENTGTYGVYPVQSTDVLIERVEVSGVDDAGIYAGQCENVVVRDSVVHGNVLGIELENTIGGEVYNNHAFDNALGIFIVILPNLTSKLSANTVVYDNIAENNNHENFAPEGNIARLMPPGIGILVLGADSVEIRNNIIRDNKSTGTAVFSLANTGAFDDRTLDIGQRPENNWLHGNEYSNNGYDPDQFILDLGIPVGDILWDISGAGNRFDEPQARNNFPPILPGSGWPGFVQRAYWHAFNLLLRLVG